MISSFVQGLEYGVLRGGSNKTDEEVGEGEELTGDEDVKMFI